MKYHRVCTPLTLAILLLAAVPAWATFEPASCGEVATWVDEHRNDLPKSLAEFTEVPDGYQVGVFNALPLEQRNELWTAFLDDVVEVRSDLETEQVLSFANYFAEPTEYLEPSKESKEILQELLASFTLRLVNPIAEQLSFEGIDGVKVAALCNCNRHLDFGCGAMFCTFTQSGCGPSTMEPCTGMWGD